MSQATVTPAPTTPASQLTPSVAWAIPHQPTDVVSDTVPEVAATGADASENTGLLARTSQHSNNVLPSCDEDGETYRVATVATTSTKRTNGGSLSTNGHVKTRARLMSSGTVISIGTPGKEDTMDSRPISRIGTQLHALSMALGIEPRDTKLMNKLRQCLQSQVYSVVSGTALGIALFGGALFLIFDIPDNPGTALLDTIMTLVTIFFVIEIAVMWVAGQNYPLSFFFWMDCLGTVSMVFEISFLLGSAGKERVIGSDVNPVLLRSARAAKTGARAARLSKVAKCFTRRRRKSQLEKENKLPDYDAQILKARLSLSLSTKISMLTVALIIITPLFGLPRYPGEDYSMKSWSQILEFDYLRSKQQLEDNASLTQSNFFSQTVNEMVSFYRDLSYHPYKIVGYPSQVTVSNRNVAIPGEHVMHEADPSRKQNVLQQKVKSCLWQRPGCEGGEEAKIYFNFESPNQLDAYMDIAVIIFIIGCMVLETADLSRTVNAMVVRPVEKMLGTVQMMANILSTIEPYMTIKTRFSGRDAFEHISELSEAQILENVFVKFRGVVGMFMEQAEGMVDEEEVKRMDYESQGVVRDILGLKTTPTTNLVSAHIVSTTGKVVECLPVAEEDIASWGLELISLSSEDQTNILLYVFFDSTEKIGSIWADVVTFQRFHDIVKTQYYDNPYHNYTHAVDVTVCLSRVFRRLRCREWMSDIDQYAMMVSALCHDLSHPGRTTPFLVETRHELAVRYNDSSPLENMHCAKMFEICSLQESDVFEKFDRDAFKQARKVCISSILHTDNSLHFEMVKACKEVYDQTSDICDAQASVHDKFNEGYMEEVLCKNTSLWHQMLLHLCDVSTPLKPWNISKTWAFRVQDEFFAQGDEEKNLGIPVGMLNDREKVSRTGAEHGFINFLVAPLVLPVVGSFPLLHFLASTMIDNLKEWRNLWAEDTKPSSEDLQKRDADVKKLAEQVEKLRVRKPIPTVRTVPNISSFQQTGSSKGGVVPRSKTGSN